MSCPVVHTGSNFLAAALAHIDCQAATIGSFGFGALSGPGSPVLIALVSLLTIFIAMFGIRLILSPTHMHDLVSDILRIGIALMIMTSWPAWRVIGYDVVIHGPSELAQIISASAGLPGGGDNLDARLQNFDRGLAALNNAGTGRLGVSQGDWFQLGFARAAYLAPLPLHAF
jgi:type IV secretion system protein VirB6